MAKHSNKNVIEVFADITCPFTHIGLTLVTARRANLDTETDVLVRAWPLEWVNGVALDANTTGKKIEALRDQLRTELFAGFRSDHWPDTTIAALNLVATAYHRNPSTGLDASLMVRRALFEEGRDISDPNVLMSLAVALDLPPPPTPPMATVVADYREGQRRGITGSPHFWIDQHDFFCPSLEVGHDDSGAITASFDAKGLTNFLSNFATLEG